MIHRRDFARDIRPRRVDVAKHIQSGGMTGIYDRRSELRVNRVRLSGLDDDILQPLIFQIKSSSSKGLWPMEHFRREHHIFMRA